ncbi:endonuclease/exonuclease/phosphatase family protein [Polaribacter sp. Asnod6-C07]|uniref:endonuclease/exonuclease/phosphatase family protein n=1 Tax=Polaribacter sp. Asnod6-C07 TaxID=3160582 RepID=UPI00386F5FFC
MKKLSFINKLIYIINSLMATCLLFSYLLPYVSPQSFPIFAILSLLAPILIVINLVFVLYWLINIKKQFLLSTLILLLGWFIIPNIYKFSEKEISNKEDLKVMSYNVRMFNYWNWIDDKKIPENINNFIKNESPDILLFQEFFNQKGINFNYKYKYIKSSKLNSNFGLAIYSKFPIINKGSFDFKNTSNNIIFTDILKKKDTIRIYNIHLQSLGLNTDKENFGQENSEKLVARLKEGFKKQAEQTSLFLEHEKKWKGKKIVAGDFNNTSYSWVYNQISEDKKDAFIEAGKGFGKSFNYWFPMRIDFILTDENAEINQFTSFTEKNSDHFPIQAKINW